MKRTANGGFTLIEIIVALVVGAILATVVVQVMGTNLARSADPLRWVRRQMGLRQAMEKMTADYKYLVMTDATPLATFKARVEANTYGSYTASCKYIAFDGADQEQAAPCSTDCRLLKVTISDGNQKLTALFTR